MAAGGKPDTVVTSVAYSLAVCVAFCLLSTWCTLYNKYIFENVFKSSNCLLLVQNVVTVFALMIGRSFKIVTFTPSFGLGDWVCGLAYGLNVMTGLWSLVYVNIAMFSTLKRCTLVASWVLEYVYNRSSTTQATLAPCIFMLLSTIFAGFFDLQFSMPGYLLSIVSCVAQGSSFELGRRMTVQNKGVCSVLLINSLATILLQFSIITMSGEMSMLNPYEIDGHLAFHFILNSVSCLLMNYTIFLNCQVNSPLAHTVTGNVKAVSVTMIGVMIFTTKIQSLGWLGILGNCVGAGWFSYVKLSATLRKQRESSNNTSSSGATALGGGGSCGGEKGSGVCGIEIDSNSGNLNDNASPVDRSSPGSLVATATSDHEYEGHTPSGGSTSSRVNNKRD